MAKTEPAKYSFSCKQKDLQIGDVVRLWEDGTAYMDATIYYVDDRGFHLIRPYISTSDMITTGGLIPYIGFEDMVLPASERNITVLVRRDPEANRKAITDMCEEARVAIRSGDPNRAIAAINRIG